MMSRLNFELAAKAKLTTAQYNLGFKKINNPTAKLKIGIWVYIILLLFEGALRKWVLPGLSTPLLIIRDPIGIWLIIVAVRNGVMKTNIYLTSAVLIGVLGLFSAILVGHGNIYVALYGSRMLLIQFPLIFVIGLVFTQQDVLKLGKFWLWLSIPMTILLVLQFFSPQSAWVNRGVGGDLKGGGFSGALGYFRGPTTFSFINGTVSFYHLLACFIFYFWLIPKKHVKSILLIGASICLLMSIPFAISRALFFSVLVTLAFAFFAISQKTLSIGPIILIILIISIMIFGLSQISIFKTATDVFTTRFTQASGAEGGVQGTLGDRYLGGLYTSLLYADDIPLLGYGIGLFTNVGHIISTGKMADAVGEQEWGRMIGELGILMGFALIFIRVGMSIKIARAAYKALKKGDFMPWILLSFCLLYLPQGQWSQPTSLGFCVLSAGITIAALRKPDALKN